MPLGLTEITTVSPVADGATPMRMIVNLSKVGKFVGGAGRTARAMLVIAEDGEMDWDYGRKIRFQFASSRTQEGLWLVEKSRPVTVAMLKANGHWARQVATRAERLDELRVEYKARQDGAANDLKAAGSPSVPPASVGDEVVDVELMTERDLEMLPAWQLRALAQRSDVTSDTRTKIQNVMNELARGIAAGPGAGQLDVQGILQRHDAAEASAQGERSKGRPGRASGVVRQLLKAMKGSTESDDDDDDSEEPEFDVESTKGKGLRMKLLYTHRQKPGLLAKRALGEIIELTGAAYTLDFKCFDHLGNFRANKSTLHELPPLFRSYAQRLDMKTNLRTRREVDTIALVLDLLVQKKINEGADVLVQRLKALEQAHTEGTWERAQWHELLAPSNASLASREELAGAARENFTEKKMSQRFAPPQRPSNPVKKEERKGDKGKGKGKGTAEVPESGV